MQIWTVLPEISLTNSYIGMHTKINDNNSNSSPPSGYLRQVFYNKCVEVGVGLAPMDMQPLTTPPSNAIAITTSPIL